EAERDVPEREQRDCERYREAEPLAHERERGRERGEPDREVGGEEGQRRGGPAGGDSREGGRRRALGERKPWRAADEGRPLPRPGLGLRLARAAAPVGVAQPLRELGGARSPRGVDRDRRV